MSDFTAKCTKFDFGWGSPQTQLVELTALPSFPSWWGGGWLSRSQKAHPAVGPTGVDIRPFGPQYFVPPGYSPPDLGVLE